MERSEPLHLAAFAGLSGQNAAFGFHPAAVVGATLRTGSWRFGARATYASAAHAVPPGELSVTLVAGRAEVGFEALRAARLRLGPVAVIDLGVLHGETQGLPETRAASRPWRSAGGGLAATGPFASKLGWQIDALGIVPLGRESFSVRNTGRVYETPRMVFWLDLGLTVDLL